MAWLQEVAAEPALLAPATRRPALPRVLSVLFLDPGSKFGSMEEQLVFLARSFAEEAGLFLPLFVADPQRDVSQFHERGVEARCLDLSRFSWPILRQLLQLIREHDIGIVNWNFMPSLSNRYVWALSLLAPTVRHWYTDHNSRPATLAAPAGGIKKLLKRLFLKRYSRVLCVSRYVQECLQAQGTWSNLVCTPHFINTQRFRPNDTVRDSVRRQMNADTTFVLLTVGQLIKEKGVDVAIRAVALLAEDRRRPVELWIVGAGAEKEALEGLVAELHLEKRVRLLGLQRHVEPYMQAADCFLCPSLWSEAAGLVNLEAQACGKPVIASRNGGIPEYVAHGRTGLLFTPGAHRELAACVRQLLDDAELCSRFSRQARADALERFSPEAQLPAWLDLYRHRRTR